MVCWQGFVVRYRGANYFILSFYESDELGCMFCTDFSQEGVLKNKFDPTCSFEIWHSTLGGVAKFLTSI